MIKTLMIKFKECNFETFFSVAISPNFSNTVLTFDRRYYFLLITTAYEKYYLNLVFTLALIFMISSIIGMAQVHSCKLVNTYKLTGRNKRFPATEK